MSSPFKQSCMLNSNITYKTFCCFTKQTSRAIHLDNLRTLQVYFLSNLNETHC